jgi:hypothetical protein
LAIAAIHRLLKPAGIAVIGVPHELFLPALFKGLFRASRRYGEFDAIPGNIFKALTGRPPLQRPVAEIHPGRRLSLSSSRLRFSRAGTCAEAAFSVATEMVRSCADVGCGSEFRGLLSGTEVRRRCAMNPAPHAWPAIPPFFPESQAPERR